MIGNTLIVHCMNGNKLLMYGSTDEELNGLYEDILLGISTGKSYVRHKYLGREYVIVLDKICSLEYVKVAS